jgi:hypothetical protein
MRKSLHFHKGARLLGHVLLYSGRIQCVDSRKEDGVDRLLGGVAIERREFLKV